MVFALAVVVGLSLGLLGSGGSVLAVPILLYAGGLSVKQAVATSLATVGAVSAIGAALAWREGRLLIREALLFSVVAMAGTVGGVRLATLISDRLQMLIFCSVMILAAVRMLSKKSKPSAPSEPSWTSLPKALAVGVLTGLVGVGGGFLIVPALVSLFHLPMKKATGTSLLVIALNSAVGVAAYLRTVTLDAGFSVGFSVLAAVGLVLGMGASKRIEESRLKGLFGVALLLVALLVLGREVF